MGLRVAAKFSSLVEARVACGALQAAGFDAQLFDQNFGSVMWVDQVAIGGFRVMVPEEEVADAAAFLLDIRQSAPPAETEVRVADHAFRALPLVLLAVLSPLAGWIVVGARQRRFAPWQVVGFAMVAASLACVALFGVAGLAGRILDGWVHPG